MAERKVQNKHYSPDFDPAKIPPPKKTNNQQIKVRSMLPMRVRCNICGNYMSEGTKFNCRQEIVKGDMYLGIQIFRFYLKCTQCSAAFVIKTDPKNSDYTVEYGVKRKLESWRDCDVGLEREKRRREEGGAMESLESRALESKRRLDDVAALDELKSMKSRQETVSLEKLLEGIRGRGEEEERESLDEEDEALIRSLFRGEDNVVRIDHEDWDDDDGNDKILNGDEGSSGNAKRIKVSWECADRKSTFRSPMVKIVVKKKPNQKPEDKEHVISADSKHYEQHADKVIGVLQPLCDYESEEEDSGSCFVLENNPCIG